MINTINLFLKEVKNFSKQNWWIYIMFVLCLSIIYKTNTWNILEISIVFLMHFVWDIFSMMMWDFYINNENKKWTIFQLLSGFIFIIVAIYAFIFNWKVNYLLSQILFWFAGAKSYFYDIKWKKYKFFNYKVSIILWIILTLFVVYTNIINGFGQILQMISFVIFSTFLVVENPKSKYFWLLLWAFLMAIASWIEVYNSFLLWNIKWMDISYTLLPFTVFVFYFKSVKKYL